MLAGKRLGCRRRRRAAALGRGGPLQRVQRAVHAVERPDEAQRHHPREVARLTASRLPAGGDLADQDLVASVSRLPKRGPGGVEQLPVQQRRDLDSRVVHGLGGQLGAVVRLVPDRPEAHGRKRRALARAACNGRRIASRPLSRTARSPSPRAPRTRRSPGRVPGGDARPDRPQWRRGIEREVDADPARRGGPDDRVEWRPVRRRIGGRVSGVESRRDACATLDRGSSDPTA